jgi:hypothetical protein
MFWEFKYFFDNFEGIWIPIAHDLKNLNVEQFIWKVWKYLEFQAFDLNVLRVQ